MESFLLKISHEGTIRNYKLKLLNEHKNNANIILEKVLHSIKKLDTDNFTTTEYFILVEKIFTDNGLMIIK